MIVGVVTAASFTLLGATPLSWVNHDDWRSPLRAGVAAYPSPTHGAPVSQIATAGTRPLTSLLPGISFQSEDDHSVGADFRHVAALTAIEELGRLPVHWAGEDTIVPSAGLRAAACAFVLGFDQDIPLPHISASAEGEIGFAWSVGARQVEALLSPDGHLVWFWSEANNVRPGGEVEFDGSIPEELREVLSGPRA